MSASKAYALTLAACVCAGVSGCSGSGAGGDADTSSDYQTLASTEAITSTLGGTTIQTRGSATTISEVKEVSGSLRHDTGRTVISDGTYTLTDSDGFDSNGLLTDGFSALISTPVQGFTGSYDYVRAYNQAYVSNFTAYETQGVVGVVTQSSDIPTSGSATYNGEAIAKITGTPTSYDLNSGASTINVDFASATTSVTMTNFTATNKATGASATAPIDTIAMTDMAISGNQFSGGTLSTTLATVDVDLTGTNTSTSALGRFFGLNSAGSAPDEVGGVVYSGGDSGSVSAIFIGD